MTGGRPLPETLNILLTCGGRRVALLEAFRSAMAELGLNGRILVADATAASSAYQLADVGLLAPRTDDPSYVPWLLQAARDREVGLLVPTTDLDLLPLAENRDAFAALGCTVMIGSPEAVRLCRDKAATAELVARAGLSAVRTVELAAFRASPFYPCFAKPVHGSAGVGVGRIDSESQLRAHVAAFGEDLVLQDCLAGAEYTIDVYRGRDGQVRCIVPRQRLAVRSGEVAKGITVRDDELIDATRRLCGAIDGLWGVFCCQCRREPGGDPWFFEINPRFGGGVPLSIAAGANLPLYLLQETLALPVTAEIGAFTDKLLMLRYDRAVFAAVEDPTTLPGFDEPSFR